MKEDFVIRLRDVSLLLPARRRVPRGERPSAEGSGAAPGLVGGRLSFGRGSRMTVTALDQVDITIKDQQRVGLIGHNGAGKSVLLRVMARIYRPTRRTVETRGRISTLFTDFLGSSTEATGLENVLLSGLTLGMSRREIEARIPEIIEFSELGDYMYLPLRTYSAGMRTRLAFSVATCISPDILLVDEVIGVGDQRFRLKAQERLNDMMASAKALVVASQSPQIIREFCNVAIWLEQGRVRLFGDVEQVLREYASPAPASP